jgi:hypothetical protein
MKQIRGRICRPGVLIAIRKPGKTMATAVMLPPRCRFQLGEPAHKSGCRHQAGLVHDRLSSQLLPVKQTILRPRT